MFTTSAIRSGGCLILRKLALVDEFVRAVQKNAPDALIQFEDFLTPTPTRS